MKKIAIIEIGSTNTKTTVYAGDTIEYSNSVTIEFKKNYYKDNRVLESDLELLYEVITNAKKYANDVHVYGCSIFRNISDDELSIINADLNEKFGLEIEVVSQEDEALYTALGCYSKVDYDGNLCVFIGGGGSIELIAVNNKEIITKKYFDFGVVDITTKFESLKKDVPTCSFDEVYSYVDKLIGDLEFEADILILAGGDHLYWYNNAKYELFKNTLYNDANQPYMIPIEKSDEYDHNALETSLDAIRKRSDNPLWFDGSRAMKVITNLISHKIKANYIIPTKINMEDGLKSKLEK